MAGSNVPPGGFINRGNEKGGNLTQRELEDRVLQDASPVKFRQGLVSEATFDAHRIFAVGNLVASLGAKAPMSREKADPTHDQKDAQPYESNTQSAQRILNEGQAGTAEGKIAGTMSNNLNERYLYEEKKRREERDAVRVLSTVLSAQSMAAYNKSFGGSGLFGGDDWKTPTMTFEQFSTETDNLVQSYNDVYIPAYQGAKRALNLIDAKQIEQDFDSAKASYQSRLDQLIEMRDNAPPSERAQYEESIKLLKAHIGLSAESNDVNEARGLDAQYASISANEKWLVRSAALNATANDALADMVGKMQEIRDGIANINDVDAASASFAKMNNSAKAFISGINEEMARDVLVRGLSSKIEVMKAGANASDPVVQEQIQQLESTQQLLSATGEEKAQMVKEFEGRLEALKSTPDAETNPQTQKAIHYMEAVLEVAKTDPANSDAAKKLMIGQLDAQQAEMDRMAKSGDLDGMKAALQVRAEEQLKFTQNVKQEMTDAAEKLKVAADVTHDLYDVNRQLNEYVVSMGPTVSEEEKAKYRELLERREELRNQFNTTREELNHTYNDARLALDNDEVKAYLSPETRAKIEQLKIDLGEAEIANNVAIMTAAAEAAATAGKDGPGVKTFNKDGMAGFVFSGSKAEIKAQVDNLTSAFKEISEIKQSGANLTDEKVTELSQKYGFSEDQIKLIAKQDNLDFEKSLKSDGVYFENSNAPGQASYVYPLFGNSSFNQTNVPYSPIPSQAQMSPVLGSEYGYFDDGFSCRPTTSFADSEEFHQYDPPADETWVTPSYNKPWYDEVWDSVTNGINELFGGTTSTPEPASTPTPNPLGSGMDPNSILMNQNDVPPSSGASIGSNQGGGGSISG